MFSLYRVYKAFLTKSENGEKTFPKGTNTYSCLPLGTKSLVELWFEQAFHSVTWQQWKRSETACWTQHDVSIKHGCKTVGLDLSKCLLKPLGHINLILSKTILIVTNVVGVLETWWVDTRDIVEPVIASFSKELCLWADSASGLPVC